MSWTIACFCGRAYTGRTAACPTCGRHTGDRHPDDSRS